MGSNRGKPAVSCIVHLKVTPRSSQNRLETVHGSLVARVTAAPTDGQANAAVCELVANAARVPKTFVTVTGGQASRYKKLRIEGMSLEELRAKLGF